MSDNRNLLRVHCYSKAITDNKPGYLRDMTEKGCKITTLVPLSVKKNQTITILLVPEDTLKIGDISIEAELRWESVKSVYYFYGFLLKSFCDKESEGRYKKLMALYS